MIKWLGSPVLWGLLLILGGVLFLLENIGVFQGSGLFWAIILALGGIFFLTIFGGIRTNWWAIIPGITLLGVALLLLIEDLFPAFGGDIGGVIILGAIGIAFLLIYVMNRTYWWAIIPAGVMFSISFMMLIDTFINGINPGGIILLGLGSTFVILALMPNLQAEMKWAWIPAVIFYLIGVLILGVSINLFDYLFPITLILVGVFFVWRTVRAHN